MKDTSNPDPTTLEAKVALADAKLTELEEIVRRIGEPAANELERRVAALRVEEGALKRNVSELTAGTSAHADRLKKLETLLLHIEREESSVAHEAAFLSQGSPSSVVLAAETGKRLVDAIGEGIRKVTHGHHPPGQSVFVNHSHENLVDRYGLKEDEEEK